MSSLFSDIPKDHPYYDAIMKLYERRVVSGYEDGTFQPDKELSRAEFVKIALGSTKCYDCVHPTDPQRERYNSTPPFPDVSSSAQWYYYCIAIGKELGMVKGVRGGRALSSSPEYQPCGSCSCPYASGRYCSSNRSP